MTTKFLIVLLLPLIFSCARRPIASSTVSTISDSTTTTITERLRLDTVYFEGERVTVLQKIPCPVSTVVKADTTKQGNVKLVIKNLGNGFQQIDCIADSLMKVIEGKDLEITTLTKVSKQEVKTVVVTEIKYRVPWWVYAIGVGIVVWYFRHSILKFIST